MGKHITISTQEAARLLNKPIRTVQNMISTGKLHGELVPNQYGGGIGGEAFQVYLDEIPFEARIPYYIDKGRDAIHPESAPVDMAGYLDQYGEEGKEKLIRKMRLIHAYYGIQEAHQCARLRGTTRKEQEQLAELNGVPFETLKSWALAYGREGLASVVRKERFDKGSVYELVKRANVGDEGAVVELIGRYMWMIDACSKRDGEVDEDCKQTILVQAVKVIRQFPI